MKTEHLHSFDNLVELELNVGKSDDLFQDPEIFAELRIDEDELEIDDVCVTIGVSRAHLELRLVGCDIVPGTRLNDRSAAEEEMRILQRRTLKAGEAKSAQGGLRATINATSINAGFSAESSDRSETHTSSERNWIEGFVVARPGKRWEIRDPAGPSAQKCLTRTFLANDRLCQVERRSSANYVEITGSISVRRRDLILTFEGHAVTKELRSLLHKEKFLKAIIAKAIIENSEQSETERQTGAITFSRSSLRSDD